jgi:pectin methylesterase-like acyl-CoA thioesterase
VYNSLIAGHVDYIWGYPEACLFEDCEIRSRAGGYIVQARVPSAANKGFVFLNCRLTAESGVKDGSMYLARSGGSTDYFDNVVFVNCTIGPVIAAAGWHTSPAPNPSTPTASSGWREYGSVDPSGKAVTGHNASGKLLTSAEAEPYSSRTAVLGW